MLHFRSYQVPMKPSFFAPSWRSRVEGLALLGVVALLVVLAVIQHRWLGAIAEAERRKLTEEATEKKILRNVFQPGDAWMSTGDLFRRDPNDYYHFDAGRREMVGDRQGLRFRLGDALRVQVLRASMEERKVDLRLVPPPAVQGQGKKKR